MSATTSKLEAVIMHVISMLKADITDYCDLETVDGGTTIVAKDGSCISIIDFQGCKNIMSEQQFLENVDRLSETLGIYFRNKGHQIQCVFKKDDDAKTELDAVVARQRSTANVLKMDVVDLLEENAETYAGYVYFESCYLVLWSRPSLLDPSEQKIAREESNTFRKENNVPSMKNAQNILRPISFLSDRHAAFASKLIDDLTSPLMMYSATLLDVSSAIREIRRAMYPDITNLDWTPAIPGTTIPARWKSNSDHDDASELLYPSLPEQIMPAGGETAPKRKDIKLSPLLDPASVRVGSRVFCPLFYNVPPRDPKYFNDIFNSLNRAETVENGKTRALPYSISFMLESDGMSVVAFKSLFASILAFSSEQNRNMNLSIKWLNEYRRDNGCIVKLRIGAMTWAQATPEGIKELMLRKQKLWRNLESWGGGSINEKTGDQLLGLQSNVIGLSPRHIGTPCPAPLDDVLRMLPLTRPASPFKFGSTLYRSLDGKILRYERFSSEQTTWITLIAGKPGSGKSVLMNSNHFESCLLPGLIRLPYIGIIDIGVSSSGFIDMVRDSLPDHLKHLVVYKRLQNAARDCINCLDTTLGLRFPLDKDRTFSKNFITMLVTPSERKGIPYEGMSNFVGRVIDVAYKLKSDKYERARPETYKSGQDAVLDEAVKKLRGVEIKQATTYWALVDALFLQGYVYEAEIAQRFAMPTLNTLVEVAMSEEIKSEYGQQQGNDFVVDEIVRKFVNGIREAVGDYKIFSSHTRFDLGSARIIALDLQDVALGGSAEATKQTSLMYMIARQSFMKKVAFSTEDLPAIKTQAPLYLDYFTRLISDIVDEYKVLAMDEYHKTGGNPQLTQQVVTDGREARKWNLEIILASQLMEDFGDLTKIATAMFFLDSGTEETRRWYRENLGMSEVEENALKVHVNGANKHGCTFLARFKTKRAEYAQLFTFTCGPMRLWALSTTAEDRKLRSLMYKQLPGPAARKLLASAFPGGSCKETVARLKEDMFKDATFIDESMGDSVIEKIAKDLLNHYYKSGMSTAA